MKKILAVFLTMIFASLNACYAFSEMYYLPNTNVGGIKSIVSAGYSNYDYKLLKTDPYYGVDQYYSSDYAIVILQQNGADGIYYYQSNNNKKINKAILKKIKKQGISYQEYQNTSVLAVYDRLADELRTGKTDTNRYTFEEPVRQSQPTIIIGQNSNQNNNNGNYNTYNSTPVVQENTLRGGVAKIAEGTKLNAYLQTPINTASAGKGDQIIAVLMQDLTYNNAVVFPQGSLIYGTLTRVVHASYGSRNGKVKIQFNQIVTPENKSYNISTEDVDFNVSNDGKVKSVVSNAAVGAVIGAVGGLLYAVLSGGDIGTAAAIGAGVGAGTGLAGAAIEKGVDAEIPSFTEMELVLTKPVSVTINY